MSWAHLGTSITAAFLASLVECVEALTVVLAVGSVRGWRWALIGTGSAVGVLAAIVLVAGKALVRVPLHTIQLAVGVLLVLFGLRWLRKAILRAAGLIPLHDENQAFAKNAAALEVSGSQSARWDKVAFAATFNITMLEGTEVVFIVIAIGAGGTGMLVPAILGAAAALVLVIGLGLVLHRPLATIPENTLKFAVGVLLSAFGTFWVGEGLTLGWPGSDLSILALVIGYLLIALAMVPLSRRIAGARTEAAGEAYELD